METAFTLGSLGVGLLLLAVAVILRLWSLPRWPSVGTPHPADGGPRISATARAILVGRPRRAAAAALVDLEAHDAVTIRRPDRGRMPEVRIRDIERVGADAHLILGGYLATGSTRSSALWSAIDMVGETLVRKGLTGRIVRWPVMVLVPIAIIALILTAFVLILVAPSTAAWAAAAGAAAILASILVVPTRIQRPTPAAAPLLAALRPRRDAARGGDPSASAEDIVLFAGVDRLRQVAVGPDEVDLRRVVNAADPGARRGRIVTATIDFLTSWP
ncbi:hypothetical protein ACFJGV_15315 [Cnuibacter sp. UC19_7]|uniref:hypothetical protein n=1 Tax=Cnuibacter sp. UC19_7 TaxID=3350166 RepID=UPI00366F5AD4